MTDEITPTTAPKSGGKKTAKKTAKPRAPRTVDPAVEAIRAECKAKIKALKGSVASNKLLQTIVAKRLPQLTQEHRQALFDELAKTCTPALSLPALPRLAE